MSPLATAKLLISIRQMIVNVGETEKAQINQEEHDLLKKLCAYRSDFCINSTSKETGDH